MDTRKKPRMAIEAFCSFSGVTITTRRVILFFVPPRADVMCNYTADNGHDQADQHAGYTPFQVGKL